MIYTVNDIAFEQLTPRDFEHLCYELLLRYGYQELIWRQGGADSGRDIEGTLLFSNHIHPKKTKWFFECKHYTSSGVPPAELNSKIAWADAERPDFLVIFASSYITKDARTWLEQIQSQKLYKIVVIEGPDLKNRLLQFPALIEQFFSLNGVEQLFNDVKKMWLQHKIEPSFEVLREVAEKMDPEKLTLNDLGFIFISFYRNYQAFEGRESYYGDFTEQILEPLYDRLITLAMPDSLENFEPYRGDVDKLGGNGCFDEVDMIQYDETPNPTYAHQYYHLHLNYKKSSDKWTTGHYLFLNTTYEEAIELFMLDDSDFTTGARVYSPYTPDVLKQLALDLPDDYITKILVVYPSLNVAKEKRQEE